MERESAVFTDEGNQEAYLQHAIHSRLNRPSNLPVFHISPRPNLSSPFQAPYHHEGKFQNDIFKQQNRQSEFMTGDPLLVNQPRIVHNAHHGNNLKFTSPQFLGELRNDSRFPLQHAPFAEPKPFVNERNVVDYSPLSLKYSPLFPYDISFPYVERQVSPFLTESHNSHVFSPDTSFSQQSHASEAERNRYHTRSSPFAFEKRQSQFHPSLIELKVQGNTEQSGAKLGGRHLDNRSGYHEEGFASINGQRQDRLQRDFTHKPFDNGHFRDRGFMPSQDFELQRQYHLSGDRQKGSLSNHELNQTRKSVICISSKEEGTAGYSSDSQIPSIGPRSHVTGSPPNPTIGSFSVEGLRGSGYINEQPQYLIRSPSKASRSGMDACYSPPNLFQSIFNTGGNENQCSSSHSKDESTRTGYHLLENGGYNLKTFREQFLVNNGVKGDHAEESFRKISSQKNSSPSSGEMKILKESSCYKDSRNAQLTSRKNKMFKSKGTDKNNVVISRLDGDFVNGNDSKRSPEKDSSMLNVASSKNAFAESDKGGTERDIGCMVTDEKSSAAGDDSMEDDLRKGGCKTELCTKGVVTELRDDCSKSEDKELQRNNGPDKGKKASVEHCDINNQGMDIDSVLLVHGNEEGGSTKEDCRADDGETECIGITENERQKEAPSTPKENSSSEETSDDAVVKRVLSREERAIKYAVEKFKEMEEKELTPKTGRRRGKGKREDKNQLHENDQSEEDANTREDSHPKEKNTEVKSEVKKITANRKRKKSVNFKTKDVEEENRVEKSGNRNDSCIYPKAVRKNFHMDKGLKETQDLREKKHTKHNEREERIDKKQQKSGVSMQDSVNEKDASKGRNDMQQKSYLLVPSYRGFKDFSPVVLEGRTRQRSTQSDAEKAGKQKFPILVVETVGEKQNEILVKENEDLDAKIAKESLLAERVFEHHDDMDDGKMSSMKRLSCNRMTGETVLHKAARLGYDDVVDIKIKAGADVNAKDNAGWTALHEACLRGKVNVVRVLLAYGADPNSRSESGIRPLHDAIDSNNIDIIRLLLSYGADISLETYSGIKSFQLARSKQVKEFLKGYIGDIKEPALLENLEDYVEDRWHFRGTSSFLDGDTDDAGEIFQDFPASSDVQIEFLASTKQPLPTYNLPVIEDDTIIGFRNYYLLEDVLSGLSISRNIFLKKHKVELRVLRLDELLSYINQSQLASMPIPSTSSEQSGESLIELVHIGHYAARRLFDFKSYQV